MKEINVNKWNDDSFLMSMEGEQPFIVKKADFYAMIKSNVDLKLCSELSLVDNMLFFKYITVGGFELVEHSSMYRFVDIDPDYIEEEYEGLDPELVNILNEYHKASHNINSFLLDLKLDCYCGRLASTIFECFEKGKIKSIRTAEELDATISRVLIDKEKLFSSDSPMTIRVQLIDKIFNKLGIFIIPILVAVGLISGPIFALSIATLYYGLGYPVYNYLRDKVAKGDYKRFLSELYSLEGKVPRAEDLISREEEKENLYENDMIIDRLNIDLEFIRKHPYWNYGHLVDDFEALLRSYKTAKWENYLVGKRYRSLDFIKALNCLESELFALNTTQGLVREPVLDERYFMMSLSQVENFDKRDERIKPLINMADFIYAHPYEGCEVHLIEIMNKIIEFLEMEQTGPFKPREACIELIHNTRMIGISIEKKLSACKKAEKLAQERQASSLEIPKRMGSMKPIEENN